MSLYFFDDEVGDPAATKLYGRPVIYRGRSLPRLAAAIWPGLIERGEVAKDCESAEIALVRATLPGVRIRIGAGETNIYRQGDKL